MATNDLLDIDEARLALQIDEPDSALDDALEVYVTAVSELIDKEAGFMVARTIEDERLDGGRHIVVVRNRPVTEVTEVVEYQGTTGVTLTAEAIGTTPANAYLADFSDTEPTVRTGTIRRRSGGCDYRFWRGRQNILVSYEAGRFENTAAVPQRIKRAAGVTLVNLWRDRGPSVDQDGEVVIPFASFPGFAVPNVAKELLSEELGIDAPWGYR